jgi:hypothetical protein
LARGAAGAFVFVGVTVCNNHVFDTAPRNFRSEKSTLLQIFSAKHVQLQQLHPGNRGRARLPRRDRMPTVRRGRTCPDPAWSCTRRPPRLGALAVAPPPTTAVGCGETVRSRALADSGGKVGPAHAARLCARVPLRPAARSFPRAPLRLAASGRAPLRPGWGGAGEEE